MPCTCCIIASLNVTVCEVPFLISSVLGSSGYSDKWRVGFSNLTSCSETVILWGVPWSSVFSRATATEPVDSGFANTYSVVS